MVLGTNRKKEEKEEKFYGTRETIPIIRAEDIRRLSASRLGITLILAPILVASYKEETNRAITYTPKDTNSSSGFLREMASTVPFLFERKEEHVGKLLVSGKKAEAIN